MNKYFRPYEGSMPYLFISYSHSDSETVLDIITGLYEKNCRVWYDEGIPAGNDWPKYIREHLGTAEAVIFFKSKYSMNSDNCYSEIKTAHDSNKRIICVPLDESKPDEKWSKALAETETNADISGFSEEEFFGTRDDYEQKNSSWKNYYGWIAGAAASLVLMLAMIAGLYALSTGKLDEAIGISDSSKENEPASTPAATETPVDLSGMEDVFSDYINISFPDTTQENAVRRALDRADGEIAETELANIKTLAICGKTIASDPDDIAYEDGRWLVNGIPVAEGGIGDLSLIAKMVYLDELALVNQNINDIAELSALKLLKKLNLSGNPINSFENLSGLSSLEVLNLTHTGVKDLHGLSALPSLKTVYVSTDMLPIEMETNAQYEVILAD